MRKYLLAIAIIFSMLLSCKNETEPSKDGDKDKNTTQTQQSPSTRHFKLFYAKTSNKDNQKASSYYTPFGDYNFPGAFSSQIKLSDAMDYISRYSTLSSFNNTNNFLFGAEDLLTYLQGCASKNSKTVQFMLGYNAASNKLCLLLAGIDEDSRHIYLTDNNECFVFASSVSGSASISLADISSSSISDHYNGAASVDSAQQWVNKYNSTATILPTKSWTYDISVLTNFIKNGGDDIKNIQFILCTINGALSMVITGLDDQNKHMYFTFAGKNCVLENCNPCPFCLVTSPLESCQ